MSDLSTVGIPNKHDFGLVQIAKSRDSERLAVRNPGLVAMLERSDTLRTLRRLEWRNLSLFGTTKGEVLS